MTTTVRKDGVRLGNSTITADGACKLVSYTTSENVVTMVFEGTRAVGAEEYCNYHVKNRFGTASSWIVVNYTEDEEKQVAAAKEKAGEAKAAEMVTHAGKEWTVHYAGGPTVTYTYVSSPEPGVALFKSADGYEIQVMVGDGGITLLRDDNNCMRFGKLENGRVTDGTAQGKCTPAGKWTAEMR